jgi:hypothetical protein
MKYIRNKNKRIHKKIKKRHVYRMNRHKIMKIKIIYMIDDYSPLSLKPSFTFTARFILLYK